VFDQLISDLRWVASLLLSLGKTIITPASPSYPRSSVAELGAVVEGAVHDLGALERRAALRRAEAREVGQTRVRVAAPKRAERQIS
jgi:hypothetical protein